MPKTTRTRTQRRDPYDSPAARPGIKKSARRARQVCRARFDFRNAQAQRSLRAALRQRSLRWVGDACWPREHRTAPIACNPAR